MEVGDETDFLRGYVGYSGGGGASRHAFDLEILGPRRVAFPHPTKPPLHSEGHRAPPVVA